MRVCIHEFEPINLAGKPTPELLKDNRDGTFDFEVRVVCSAGTYVRTLAEDFGKRLGLGAHLAELRRARVGDFGVQDATSLERLKLHLAEESLGQIMHLPDEALWASAFCGSERRRFAPRANWHAGEDCKCDLERRRAGEDAR